MALGAAAAERPVDRTQWIDAAVTTTSDDLRRVPIPKGFNEPTGSLLIRNARLFDGTGSPARPAAILITGSHIVRVARDDAGLELPKDCQVIDAGGRTVLPGLIDLHTHLTYVEEFGQPASVSDESQAGAALRGQERLRYFVESGVTSVRDVASHGMAPFLLKEWVASGRIPGPRVFAAGSLITGVGGHGSEGDAIRTAPSYPDGAVYEASGADGFRNAVRLQFKRGADLIKLGSHFSADEARAVVDEAHNLGLKVTVDSETIFTQIAVEAGVDCVEHPLPRSDETVKLMARRGVCADITLIPYQYINSAGGYYFSTSRRFTESDAVNLATAKKLDAAGVKIGIGTDLIVGWYKFLPDAYIQELRNYLTLGHTPMQALVAATRTNAEILGMADRLGTAEVGKLADLVLVSGRPDENLEDLRNVETVIVNGRVVVRDGRVYVPRHVQEKPPYSTAAK
jgi:imidazolonepropionase-like amidohydrolase